MFRMFLDTLTNSLVSSILREPSAPSLVETLLPHGKSTQPDTSALHFFYRRSTLTGWRMV